MSKMFILSQADDRLLLDKRTSDGMDGIISHQGDLTFHAVTTMFTCIKKSKYLPNLLMFQKLRASLYLRPCQNHKILKTSSPPKNMGVPQGEVVLVARIGSTLPFIRHKPNFQFM